VQRKGARISYVMVLHVQWPLRDVKVSTVAIITGAGKKPERI
jgi:hypothetical protein